MAAHSETSELSQLRVLVDAQQRELAAHEAALARLKRRGRPRRLLPLALAVLLSAILPLSLLAASPVFGDIGLAGEPHRADIQVLGNTGITTGFDDPTADDPTYRLYDPKGVVTREQMASFLARTAGLGDNPPLANALTAQTATNAVNAQNAGNAATVGGFAPNGLLRVARGIGTNTDASGFTIPNTAVFPAFAALPNATVTITAPGAGFVLVSGAMIVSPNDNDSTVYGRRRETTPTAAGTSSPYLVFQVDNAAADPSPGFGSLSPVFVFPVTGTGPKTFVLEVAKSANGGTNYAYNGTITALYVPFGGNGAPPATP